MGWGWARRYQSYPDCGCVICDPYKPRPAPFFDGCRSCLPETPCTWCSECRERFLADPLTPALLEMRKLDEAARKKVMAMLEEVIPVPEKRKPIQREVN